MNNTPEAENHPAPGLETHWAARYANLKAAGRGMDERSGIAFERQTGVDSWTGKPITIDTAVGSLGDDVLKRARVLQHCDHAHLQTIQDFHCGKDSFSWVCSPTPGTTIDKVLQNSLSSLQAIDLLGQLVGALHFFERQAPSVVPPVDLSMIRIAEANTLRISDYQSGYLFAKQGSRPLELAAYYTNLFASGSKELGQLAADLENKLPKFGSLQKIRTHLKHLEELVKQAI